jgi:hypothetical protein
VREQQRVAVLADCRLQGQVRVRRQRRGWRAWQDGALALLVLVYQLQRQEVQWWREARLVGWLVLLGQEQPV